MWKRTAILLTFVLLSACGEDDPDLSPSDNPEVAISKIDGPRVGGQAGALVDAVDARQPRSGVLLVAASQQFDPVSGQTTDDSISVYVTASDELGVGGVELSLDGVSMGTYLNSDGQLFKKPFIFPTPRSGLSSVPIPGAPSGLVSSELRALASDKAGQLSEAAVLEVEADGSRPNITYSVVGNGPPFIGPVTLSAQAADPETGIRSFSAFLNGQSTEINPATPFSLDAVLEPEPGTQTVKLVAENGVFVRNEVVFIFVVAEEPEEAPVEPEPPMDPEPPTEPDPPTDPEPPTGPEPPTDPVEPPTDPDENTAPTVSLTATPAEGDAPLTVTLEATASDADGDELTYLWDFGNGETATEGSTQEVTYEAAGTYAPTVLVSDGNGGQTTAQATVTVSEGDDGGGDDGGDDGGEDGDDNQAPEVSLTANPSQGPTPLTVTFDAAATDPDDDELEYRWSFGDGKSASEGAQQTYTYAEPGTYTPSVVVRDGEGGKARAEVEITVGGDDAPGDPEGNQLPAVTLTATPTGGDAPLGVTFSAEASDPDGDDLEYVWNYGDNENASGGTTRSHTYDTAATYVASVTVTDARGGKAIVEVTITVN